ncbi:MAG: hypothetical protein GXY67_03440 [Clostridiales bacterium]|nr:hypothetical protein [Clostridiales bacterium]
MIRVMDEAMDIGGRGVALILEADANPPPEGSRIQDARGNVHTVLQVWEQDGVQVMLVEGGDLAYFERLFRDVRVDATAFALAEE